MTANPLGTSFELEGYWSPSQSGFMPSIDTSFGIDTLGSAFSGSSPLGAPSPTKPGSESPFANAWMGGAMLLEGVGNLIRGIRGQEPVPGMAGSMVQQYLAQQRDEDRLNKLLDRLSPRETKTAVEQASAAPMLKTDNPLWRVGSSYGA